MLNHSNYGRWPCKLICGLLAVATSLSLILFQRFSAINYPVIAEQDILKSLVVAFDNKQDLDNMKDKGYCEIDMAVLKEYRVQLDQQLSSYDLGSVATGGQWQPQKCQSKHQIAVIIPYRDRADHLRRFLQILHPFLQSQMLDYKVIVVEQTEGKPFNRAKLFNVGFLESKAVYGHTNCLIFHDVDLIPLDGRNIYACTEEPRHLSSNLDQFRFNLPYVDLFGGAVALTTELFEESNGFSNRYFGWGGEDDDFRQNRIPSRPLVRLEPHIARYTSLRHQRAEPSANRFKNLQSNSIKPQDTPSELDGLSNIEYKVVKMYQRQLYTHFLVDI